MTRFLPYEPLTEMTIVQSLWAKVWSSIQWLLTCTLLMNCHVQVFHCLLCFSFFIGISSIIVQDRKQHDRQTQVTVDYDTTLLKCIYLGVCNSVKSIFSNIFFTFMFKVQKIIIWFGKGWFRVVIFFKNKFHLWSDDRLGTDLKSFKGNYMDITC